MTFSKLSIQPVRRNRSSAIRTCTGLISACSAAFLLSANIVSRAADASSAIQELERTRIFNNHLCWLGPTAPSEAESQDLWQAFGIGQNTNLDQALDQVETFLGTHPHSPWASSLHANLGKYYFDTVRFTLALDHFDAAWRASKDLTDQNGRQVADFTLAHWLHLLSSLGRTDTMRALFEETKNRDIVRAFQEDYRSVREAYGMMLKHPEFSYKCGTFAVSAVSDALYGTNIFAGILDQPSPPTGFSMSVLWDLTRRAGLDLVPVQRAAGEELVVPSVVHWRQNHYAAIVAKQGDKYRVVDPTFRMSRLETALDINTESSGHFMVSAKQIPAGWRTLDVQEASLIFGKGFPGVWVPPPNPPCNTCPCPPGSSGTGGSSSSGSSGSGSGSSGSGSSGSGSSGSGTDGCKTCEAVAYSAGGPGGMPTWTVLEPFIDLWIQDEPLGYQPATGPRISAGVHYDERSEAPVDSTVFGMGPSWGSDWLSYIDTGANTLYSPGGGSIAYGADMSGTVLNYYDNSRMLYINNANGVPTTCKVFYPNGGVRIYGFMRTNVLNAAPTAFLTQIVDPAGRTTTFIYAPWNATNNDVIRLQSVVDADGLTNTIRYTSAANFGTNLVSEIVDPYNRTNKFKYDANGNLTNIVDVIGLSSSFSYGRPLAYSGNTWITNMTTPYGVTTFDYTQPFTNGDLRGLVVTDPDGGQEMFYYEGDGDFAGNPTGTPKTYTDTSNVPTSRPTSTLNNPDWNHPSTDDYMNWANSYYWNRQQAANVSAAFLASGPNYDYSKLSTNDFFNARLRHWNVGQGGNDQDNNLGMERLPSPDHVTVGKMMWYDYPGKPNNTPYLQEGTTAFPALMLNVLPDGSNRYTEYVYDQSGNVTNVITTYTLGGSVLTRTNRYVYAANGIDLLYAIGPDGVTNASYVYNSNHRVLFMTNAVGDVTSYTYNANQQVTSVKYPTQLISSNIYYANGFVATNYEYSTVGGTSYFRSNYFTYTNGLVYTRTDERGLVVTNTWDNLQRLTKQLDPNGAITYTYDKLDLVQIVDRMGFTNSFGYDQIRRKVAETNALGNPTTYGYCPCGGLAYITNALNQVTQFVYDYQGNLITKLYPDGYNVTNEFNSVRQPVRATDTSGSSRTNSYNNQGLLIGVNNAFGQIQATVYDIYDRPTSQTDANGVTVTTTYDKLGRATTRSYPDGGVEKFGYSAFGLTVYTNQLGFTNTYAYDAARRKISELNANGEFTQFQYDSSGNLTNLLDGKTNFTKWNYDQFGRVTKKIDAASNTLFTYGYDANDRLTARTNATSIWTHYFYDKVGSLTNIIYQHNASIANTYDALNRMTKMVDGVGTTMYSYDAAGQVLSEGGLWANDTVYYTNQNRLRTGLSLQSPSGSSWVQSYRYDLARRLTNVVSAAGSFGYSYDSSRHMQVGRLTLPNGAYIADTYDNVARLLSTTLKNSGNTALNSHTYGYNSGNQRTALTNFLGDYRQYTYDKIGQLKTALGKEAGGVTNRWQEQFGYGYDAAGNLSWRTNYALAEAFNVNNLNELTTATNAGTLTIAGTTTSAATNVTVWGTSLSSGSAFLYADITWVRTNVTRPGGSATYYATGYDSLGRKDTNTVNVSLPNTITYTYDLNGNLTSDGTRWFAYDDENQLVSVWVTNAWRSDFVYDGRMRRRIRREWTWAGTWVQTNEVRYVYDGNLPIQERDINNLPMLAYTRGTDLSGSFQGAGGIGGLLARSDHRLLAIGDPNAQAFYHADGNGNITALLSTNQVLVAKYLYDPYGNVLSQTGPFAAANTYQFSSKEFHGTSGLLYYLHRFYDANLQRWVSTDPLDDRSTLALRSNRALQKARLGSLGSGRYVPAHPESLRRYLENLRSRIHVTLGKTAAYNAFGGYGFLQNDSINTVDPYGECGLFCAIVVGVLIGTLIGIQITSHPDPALPPLPPPRVPSLPPVICQGPGPSDPPPLQPPPPDPNDPQNGPWNNPNFPTDKPERPEPLGGEGFGFEGIEF